MRSLARIEGAEVWAEGEAIGTRGAEVWAEGEAIALSGDAGHEGLGRRAGADEAGSLANGGSPP